MATYIALIRKDENTCYGAEFPDFPGCISVGDTLQEAAANAKEALLFHVEGMVEDGEDIPEPRPLDDVPRDDVHDAVPVLIDVPIVRRSKRVNISIDEGLLERIDEAAASCGTTRSGFLANAAVKALRRLG